VSRRFPQFTVPSFRAAGRPDPRSAHGAGKAVYLSFHRATWADLALVLVALDTRIRAERLRTHPIAVMDTLTR
jgi:hypothetical protein